MENYQIQQEIKIDFATPDVPPRVYAKQYDNNMRIIKTNLYANGQPYTVQSGFDVNVRMAKPDGTYVYNPALEASGTYALIVLTQQMLAVAGECPAEIEVTQGSNVLSTATFVICVAADPVPEHAIESTNEFKTIQELAAKVEAAAKVVTDNLDAINAVSENIEAIKNAPQQAQNAANSATLAQSWAAGGTGTREGEDTDNAKYYAQIAQQVAQGGVGYYETPEALRAAHPTGQAGNWAIVGSTDTIWVWDTDTGDWVDSHGNIDLSNYYTKTEADARFSAISSGVPTVSATKEQNYFDIELPSTNQFVIVPNAAYATGNTFRIAGRTVAAMLPNGDSLPDAFFAANAKVMCLWADTVLYFVGGGGTVPNNVMRYRMDDGTPGQQPEQTIWGQTSDGQDAYVHSCTKAVYNPETGKTLDEDFETMAIHTYTCVTSGTNHALTGTGNNIKFVADADFDAGDTITVNGQAVTAQTQDGSALSAGAWASGATVMCWLNGTILTVSGGGSGSGFTYSTNEQWTGKWWKDPETQNLYKIYSKIWVTGALNIGNNIFSLGTSIKQPISCGGTLFLQRGDTWVFPMHIGNFNADVYTINMPGAKDTFIVTISGFSRDTSIVKAHIWMEYIKNE